MNEQIRREKIEAANREIALILRVLEEETGELVEAVDLCAFDVTNMNDPGPQSLITPRIRLVRKPGHRWS